MEKFLAIVPARKGSRGLPGKNTRDFCGTPLVVWSILQALSSKYIERVVVSSDDNEVLRLAKRIRSKCKDGSKDVIPHRRPKNLCLDDIGMKEVLNYYLKFASGSGHSGFRLRKSVPLSDRLYNSWNYRDCPGLLPPFRA